MFVELIESLRCPNPHEPSALVASASRVVARHVTDGTLGCPVCGAEFPIERGVARFTDTPALGRAARPSDALAMHLAAFLELTDALGFSLLCGSWASHAERMRRLTDAPVVFVNADPGAPRDIAAAVLEVGDVLPLADGSARAAALDDRLRAPGVASVVAAVRGQGRLVAPAAMAVPPGAEEIARDDRLWVARKRATPPETPLLQLARAPG